MDIWGDERVNEWEEDRWMDGLMDGPIDGWVGG